MKRIWLSLSLLALSCSLVHAQTTTEIPLDLVARSNAKGIYATESTSYIALAFRDAQFTVLMRDGLHYKGKNGIHFPEWHAEMMALGIKNNAGVKLKDFILAWQLAATAKGNVIQNQTVSPELIKLFLADLRAAVNLPSEDTSGRRRLAQTVVALGRLNPFTPYDLLADNVSPDVPLNAVQIGLLSYKMAADLWIKAHKEQGMVPSRRQLKSRFDIQNSSCVLTDTEGLIYDATAVYSGLMVGGFYDFLASTKFISETGAARFAKITGISNIVLSYVKFIWSMAAFDAKLIPSKNPLVRTKTRTAGEDVDILGTFKMDGSSLQIVNCLRPALNAAGIDFSLPQGGPLAGVLVEWEIATRVGSSNDVVQTVGVDPRHQETDKEGRNQITVQGKPQAKDLSQVDVVEVDRIVPIIATVNLKNKNPAQDMVDLFSLTGGASNFFTQPLEILNRAPVIFSGKLNLEVRDFKELEGDLFQVVGEYVKPMEQEAGANAWLKDIKDSFIINLEVKTINKKVVTELLTVVDVKSQYISDYPAEYIEGEGCKVQQTAVGDFEVFMLNKKSLEIKGSMEREPDRSTYAKVSIDLKGSQKIRGFKYKYQSPCPTEDIKPQTLENAVSLNLSFDSKQLNQVGKTLTLDRRVNGVGWILKVTYLK